MSVQISKNWNYTPKSLSWNPSAERWKKTAGERVAVYNLKHKLFTALREAGYDPRKRMNLSEPFKAIIW
jgi:hypothetical protein